MRSCPALLDKLALTLARLLSVQAASRLAPRASDTSSRACLTRCLRVIAVSLSLSSVSVYLRNPHAALFSQLSSLTLTLMHVARRSAIDELDEFIDAYDATTGTFTNTSAGDTPAPQHQLGRATLLSLEAALQDDDLLVGGGGSGAGGGGSSALSPSVTAARAGAGVRLPTGPGAIAALETLLSAWWCCCAVCFLHSSSDGDGACIRVIGALTPLSSYLHAHSQSS